MHINFFWHINFYGPLSEGAIQSSSNNDDALIIMGATNYAFASLMSFSAFKLMREESFLPGTHNVFFLQKGKSGAHPPTGGGIGGAPKDERGPHRVYGGPTAVQRKATSSSSHTQRSERVKQSLSKQEKHHCQSQHLRPEPSIVPLQ